MIRFKRILLHSLIRCPIDNFISIHDLHRSSIIVKCNIVEEVNFLKSFIILTTVSFSETVFRGFLHHFFEAILKLLKNRLRVTYVFEKIFFTPVFFV